ncbi:MAG: sigma-E factor negative regulatory protein [Steroidobacteraceae bacterium]|jgi:sigma-E factor negative regulatory protein RseA
MSDQIREQVSAFLDGELPDSETELLLKRLTRDAELREGFGRYALIGETLRGASRAPVSRGFAARVNRAIDGEPATAIPQTLRAAQGRWWKPVAGAAVAAGVAAVAVVALQQRAISPAVRATLPAIAQNAKPAQSKEALSYIVPAASPVATAATTVAAAAMPATRLTSYVFAHSNYVSGLGQGNVLSGLLADPDDLPPAAHEQQNVPAAAPVLHEAVATQQRDPRTAP